MGNPYLFMMHMENTFIGELKYSGDSLMTTKTDEEQHGLGFGIVRKLAKKYNGTLNMEVHDNRFYTTLMIPVNKECENEPSEKEERHE